MFHSHVLGGLIFEIADRYNQGLEGKTGENVRLTDDFVERIRRGSCHEALIRTAGPSRLRGSVFYLKLTSFLHFKGLQEPQFTPYYLKI